jgi:DNA polymerase V
LLVFLDTNHFREDLPQHSQHIIINLPVATNSSIELVDYVSEGLGKIYRSGFKYKKTGVMLLDICSQDAVQGSIWDTIDREKHKRLMEVLDRTNDKFGRNTLKLAVLGDGEQWKIKQERLSPCYTTRMEDFPKTK